MSEEVTFEDVVWAEAMNMDSATIRTMVARLTEQMTPKGIGVLAKEWIDEDGNVNFHIKTNNKTS